MVTESFFSLFCAGLIGALLGLYLTFAGYRFFLFLLPVWGFFFGLTFGAHTMLSLFGMGFLATITSWVVGFVVGAIFAVLSYFFYFFAVGLVAGSLGYAVGAGLMLAIFPKANFLSWIVGIVIAVILAIVTLVLNLQKYVVIIATSVLGAGVVFATFLFMFYPAAKILENPVKLALQGSPLLIILFLVLAICGIVVQIRMNQKFEVESYDRWAEPGV
jgi:hypothetical protein